VQRSSGLLSTRLSWTDLPSDVRSSIAELAGGRIISVEPIIEGFSPGFIARVERDDGLCLFVKVSDDAVNDRPGRLHKREASVLNSLTNANVAPGFVGTVQEGNWCGIVTEFMAGQTVQSVDQLGSALRVADGVSQASKPGWLESLPDLLQHDFLWFGLRRLSERDGHLPHGWDANQTSQLLGYERYLLTAVAGDHLVHGDMRADNILIKSGGSEAIAVDWPAAAVGNPCFDIVMLCASVAEEAGAEPGNLLAQSDRCRYADPQMITALIVGMYGHYLWASTLGNPPGIPGVRAYQASMATTFARWVAARIS
jgi:hypothetical protein